MAQSLFRPLVSAAVGLLGIGSVALLPVACQGTGIGDPCTPEDEYNPNFQGFKVTEENIESRSFQCQSRLCLVNHFQGRASCPLGQAPPVTCFPENGNADCAGVPVPAGADAAVCTRADTPARACDNAAEPGTPLDPTVACAGLGACNDEGKFCECVGTCPDPNQRCTALNSDGSGPKVCVSHVCHVAGNCQDASLTQEENTFNDASNITHIKDCCVPGTDTPITVPVCGQCGNRAAEAAVYCSCRCGPAGTPCDDANPCTEAGKECKNGACVTAGEADNFNYCTCPDEFECAEIRKNVGLGDKQLTGKYCIKTGTNYDDPNNPTAKSCGEVHGYFNSTQCDGLGLGI